MNGKDKATPVSENFYRMLYLQASWRVTDTNQLNFPYAAMWNV